MTVSPETLDTALCEWCTPATPAAANASYTNTVGRYHVETVYLCTNHCQEIASEFTNINLYPLANKPHYTLLETYANPMTGEYTIKELELAARYGAPYPVCGDLTRQKRIMPVTKRIPETLNNGWGWKF